MGTQKPDSPEPVPAPKPALSVANGPVPAPRSEALEAELAMLEAILPPEAKGSPKDGGDTR